MVAFDRRFMERGGDVIATLRDAGRVEPDLAAAHRQGRSRAMDLRRRVIGAWPAGTVRDVEEACATYAGLCNIDTYRSLIEEQGWSPDRVERWWRESLVRLLLP
ncbi:hypothetical protein [Pseudonocardia sp. GCM10023141]|uniref:hypothetical protein n=1 Tax=Pseudonocardia sp. GCM10023141 TaxID=3252653 RepID=UPI00361B0371